MYDQSNIKKLLQLSDKDLVEKVTNAAAAAGAEINSVKTALKDIEKLRNALGALTPRDIEQLINLVGEEKAKEIARKLES